MKLQTTMLRISSSRVSLFPRIPTICRTRQGLHHHLSSQTKGQDTIISDLEEMILISIMTEEEMTEMTRGMTREVIQDNSKIVIGHAITAISLEIRIQAIKTKVTDQDLKDPINRLINLGLITTIHSNKLLIISLLHSIHSNSNNNSIVKVMGRIRATISRIETSINREITKRHKSQLNSNRDSIPRENFLKKRNKRGRDNN